MLAERGTRDGGAAGFGVSLPPQEKLAASAMSVKVPEREAMRLISDQYSHGQDVARIFYIE